MDNPPAFPIPDVRTHDGFGVSEGSPGMSLRDWFAGQAIGHIMGAALNTSGPMAAPSKIAGAAYATADAMLAARAQEATTC